MNILQEEEVYCVVYSFIHERFIVSSRTHGLFVHLSQRRNVGKTLIYVHKRIKNTPRALERSGGGVQRYTYATSWHCSLCESYKKSVNADYPSLTLHRRQTDPSGW